MEKITFGRSQDNDIVIDDKSVSRHHGYLQVEGGRVYVVDDDSLNGIFVNGQRIAGKVMLSSGDVVLVAKVYKLDWRRYCRVEPEMATIRNERVAPKVEEKKKSSWTDSAFAKGLIKTLMYIFTTVLTLVIVALVNKMLR